MRILLCTAALVLCLLPAHAQSGVVQGRIRDSQGRPVAGATLYLHVAATNQDITAQSNAGGNYRFAALPPDSYTLRAQAGNAGEAVAAPFVLQDGETKTIDLTLQDAYFDAPNFIAAGVTDTMSRGGHGSDTVMRSAEALAKATASLSKGSPAGTAAERDGKPLEAVREYQRAAELDASEVNLFDWGAELLKHRANEPATEVFSKGRRLFPHSLRMLLGLAAAWYARGSYEQAAELFFAACDLDPSDPEPYMFLGKVQSIEILQLPGYSQRLRRFVDRYPENAWANYYYAVSLWKQRKSPDDTETPGKVRGLLEKAIHIDPAFGAAYLQLGILLSEQRDYARAIAAFRKAIDVSPRMEEAHYRLGQVYGRTGEKEKAGQELQTYRQMARESAEAAERERSEIQQFVYELRGPALK